MLYTISVSKESKNENLSEGEKISILYHDLFDFPLTFPELIKWKAGEKAAIPDFSGKNFISKNGFYFLEGKEGMIYKRALNKRVSAKKMAIAVKAAYILSLLPTVKMVAVTGSLAMENAGNESDIDLMIITGRGTLWMTRLISLIGLTGQIRRAGNSAQKDKLCLNIWMDETDLEWSKKDRNIYSAHEIGQIRPLINKDNTYEKFLEKNKWVLKYWPNSVRILKLKSGTSNKNPRFQILNSIFMMLEKFAYQLQLIYMKPKITREIVTPTRALFHPYNWGKVVLDRLKSFS